jgi:hypothetical protein
VKGETLGIYLEDEGEGEICMEQTYLMERKRIPQESARITRGEPWSLEVALESSKPVWEDREDWDEGVREEAYMARNPIRRIYPTRDQIYLIRSNMFGLDTDISGGLGLSEILPKICPGQIYPSWLRTRLQKS